MCSKGQESIITGPDFTPGRAGQRVCSRKEGFRQVTEMYHDTIAAVGTAMTQSGIGIIRISGEEAIEVGDRIFRSKKKDRRLSQVPTHTIHYGYIVDGDQVIDEVLVSVMKGPHSYTAEDVVEINCHGGVLVMKRILELVLRSGARPAEAGEFTKRAFLNGRMDLSQAEAVIDLINSKNDFAMKSAVKQLSGTLSEKIRQLREKILYETAFIESALDDPEHYSMDGYGEKLSAILDGLMLEMGMMISGADNGRLLSEGIRTVILGKPNAGKSSLLNLLVGEDRAIVTEVAGTTRDTLEEQILLDGIGLHIVDTAGIRDTEDIVEKIGVGKALQQAEEADLILYVVDSSVELDENDMQIIQMIRDKKAIVLLNKSDLEGVIDSDRLCRLTDKRVITFSAREGYGMMELKHAIQDMFDQSELALNDEWCLTSIRHKQAMQDAYESLRLVRQSIEDGMPEDFYSIDLMNAYQQLGTIIGEAVEDDLVDEIFSQFCMGK